MSIDEPAPLKPAPGPSTKKQGVLFSWLEKAEQDKAEYEQAKAEKMQEIHTKRVMEKLQKQQEKEGNGSGVL